MSRETETDPASFEIGSVKFLKPFALITQDFHAYNYPAGSFGRVGMLKGDLTKKIAVNLINRGIAAAIPLQGGNSK